MSKILTAQPEQHYFGKFPARGDFVRSATGSTLLNVFDQWISRALDMLAPDPRWKIDYDASSVVRFAFIGTRNRTVVAGALTPSMDSSERRFPFILATRFEVVDSLDFFSVAPIRLARYWQSAEMVGLRARQAVSDQAFLQALGPFADGIALDGDMEERRFDDYLQQCTVEQFDDELRSCYPGFSLRRTVLALGMLLQPVSVQGAANLHKGLVFPLPTRADTNALAASFWLSLIACFLSQHDFELSILLSRSRDKPVLLIGFAGAAADALVSMISPDASGGYLVDIADADWVEEYADTDAGHSKLSSYASHPQLSLAQLRATFNEVFMGL